MEKVVQVPSPTQAPSPIAQVHQTVMKQFPKKDRKNKMMMAAIAVVVVLAGVGTGWFLAGPAQGGNGGAMENQQVAPGAKKSETEAGMNDESAFPDSVEGTLEEGGIDGEGTHHLTRPGGDSQNVYLTSTVINLDDFVGKKVMVWGQTVSGKKAGWLMDVGKIKITQ